MSRIALGIEYDGTEFFGWQTLTHGASVQAAVTNAVSLVADQRLEIVCAGRTDSGVHAIEQVAHFDTQVVRSARAWTLGASAHLPSSVAVIWAREVAPDFHARYCALTRRYRYTIVNRAVRPGLEARFVAWERKPLAVEPMRAAAAALLGEHDFSAFRTIACQARSPHRRIDALSIERVGERIVIEIEGNAFLHHMVRNIVGSLIPIGRGEQPVSWLAQLLEGRDRRRAGPTASASGLVFVGPRYPLAWGLPASVCAGPDTPARHTFAPRKSDPRP